MRNDVVVVVNHPCTSQRIRAWKITEELKNTKNFIVQLMRAFHLVSGEFDAETKCLRLSDFDSEILFTFYFNQMLFSMDQFKISHHSNRSINSIANQITLLWEKSMKTIHEPWPPTHYSLVSVPKIESELKSNHRQRREQTQKWLYFLEFFS